MAESAPKSYSSDPTLWLYTSLTSGSSQIITATSRLETILKANKIPFKALDVATDEKARMLWGRRAAKRKLPGLVRMGMVVADIEQVEEWNEYGEIKQNLIFDAATSSSATPSVPAAFKPPPTPTPSSSATTSTTPLPASLNPSPQPLSSSAAPKINLETSDPLTTAMRQASLEAAAKANASKAQSTAKSGLSAKPSTVMPSSGPSADLNKLDNSTLPGTTPPVGSTNASDASKPVADSKPKAERQSVHFKGDDKPKLAGGLKGSAVTEPDTKTHRGASISAASPEEIKKVEESQKIEEEPEDAIAAPETGKVGAIEADKEPESEPAEKADDDKDGGLPPPIVTSTSEAATPLGQTTETQEQDAASGENAGESVGD